MSLVAISDNGAVKFEMINLNSRAIWFESEQLGNVFIFCSNSLSWTIAIVVNYASAILCVCVCIGNGRWERTSTLN